MRLLRFRRLSLWSEIKYLSSKEIKMARTSMEQKAFGKTDYIAKCAKIDPDKVIGILMRLWNHSQDQGIEVVNREWLTLSCFHNTRRKNKQDALLKEFITHRFLEKIGDDAYRIKGNAKHNSRLVAYKNKMKFARQAKLKKQENVKGFNDNGYHLNEHFDEYDANPCFETALPKHETRVLGETREVIHNPDSKTLPVADSKNKTKHVEFKSTSMHREMDWKNEPSMDRILLQLQVQPGVSSSSSSLNFNKKEKEEKLIEASTNFVYEEKTSAIDEHFDNACQKYREKFEHRVDWKINAGQNAKLRYSQLIKSGVNHDQVLDMINNYADAKFTRYPNRDGFFSIHQTFERFLGFPGDWHCKKYLTPIVIVDRSKLERNTQSKVRADIEEEARLERAAEKKAKRLFRLGYNLEEKKIINDRIENEKRMKQEGESKRKPVDLSGTDFKTAGDILNGMNFKF